MKTTRVGLISQSFQLKVDNELISPSEGVLLEYNSLFNGGKQS